MCHKILKVTPKIARLPDFIIITPKFYAMKFRGFESE